jgi:hypothetical protein
MGVIAFSFLAATLVVLSLSFVAWREDHNRHGDLLACSGMLLTTWAISNILTELYTVPDAWVFYPVMDAICGAAVMWAWLSKPSKWKIGLAGLFLLQCALHVAFWLHIEKTPTILYTYALALNLIFGAQLLVTGWSGGAHVVDRVVRALGLHHVPAGTYPRHPIRPGPL